MQSTITVEQAPSIQGKSRSREREALLQRYANRLEIKQELTRALVSNQANKKIPFYRWLKYKEAFSSELVRYFLNLYYPSKKGIPRILDPFAGAGTTLTTSTKIGWRATGIELLPIGIAAMKARLYADEVDVKSFIYYLNRFKKFPLESHSSGHRFQHLRITEKAFSKQTEKAISAYMDFINKIRNQSIRYLFWFACLSVLEDVSFTRKDGQYLRWDHRSGRSLKSKFDKGIIPDFGTSIMQKLDLMHEDIKMRNGGSYSKNVDVREGSCLEILPGLPENSFDLVLTSPPYCNRYDYTRTYALELAYIGYDEEALKRLRQTLLSATVENKSKGDKLADEYRSRNQEMSYRHAINAFENQHALHEILGHLYKARDRGELNNNSIPSMVENYFFEMNLVVRELARVLAPGGHIVMVNDNVRYHGEEVPVDLILSDFAYSAGLDVDRIWVLPRGKGNSSQQMGAFGRNELRKCVYVWSKPY